MNRAFLKKFGIITSLLTLLLCTVVNLNSTEASATNEEEISTQNPLTSVIEEAEDRTDNIYNSNINVKLNILAKEAAKEAAKLFTNDELDFSKANILEVDNKFYAVQVPVKSGSKLESVSGITLTFDKKFNVINTTEISLELLDEEHAKVIMLSDGNEVRNEVLVKPDVAPQWSTSYLNDCLAAQGISWAVLALVGSACTLGCLASAGAACVWCVMTVTAGSGSVVATCVKKAAQK
ncbi:hypothetical protein ACIQY5_25880 [Peribacillus frigoritolerans]|uniref:hypothetical protein n=1 Tax=Peribacillus frigoritolerans TaxID=450367 RepID=UPI0037F18174